MADKVTQLQSEMRARQGDLRRGASDPTALSDIQLAYNDTYASLDAGGAPPPRYSESPATFEARLIDGIKRYAPKWEHVDVYAIDPVSLPSVGNEVRTVIADRIKDPTVGDLNNPSLMRRVEKVDPLSGQREINWHGSCSWMRAFMPDDTFATRIGHQRPVKIWIGDEAK